MRTPRYLIYTDLDQDEELPEAYDSETRQYTFRAQPEVTRNPDHHHMFSDTQSQGRYQPVGRPSGPYPRGLAAEYSSPAPEPYQETKSGYDAGRARERTFTRAAKVIAKKAFHILIDTFRHSDPSLLATAGGTSPTRTPRRPTNWRVDADSGDLVMNDDDDDDDDNGNGPPTSSYRIDPKRHVRWQNQQQKKTRRSAKVVGGRSRRMPVPVYGFETGGKYPSARAGGAERRRMMMMDMANNRSSRSRYGGSGAFGAFGGGGGGRARYQYPQYLL